MATQQAIAASDPDNYSGYRTFNMGSFGFRRDEYFAHIDWPNGQHVMSIDVFLRALQRTVAWNFFLRHAELGHGVRHAQSLRQCRYVRRAL